MNLLFPLRPIQIVDVSFQLLRKKFAKSFVIALAISIPLQMFLWILEVSISDSEISKSLSGRTKVVVTIVQFFAVGFSLAITSNILSGTTGRIYCASIFDNLFGVRLSPMRFSIGLYHAVVQIIFLVALLGFRFALGHITSDTNANVVTVLCFLIVAFPWILFTLRVGFMIPISTNENKNFQQIRKRCSAVNRIHFWKLFGAYCICLMMIFVLVFPSLGMIQYVLAKNVVKSSLGSLALFNIILAVVIASISVVYSYILTVTYFNARIEHEGFDVTVAIEELEREGNSRGKLLDPVA